MEEELNYLSEKIADIEQDANYHEIEARKTENKTDLEHHNMMAEKKYTEIEYLNNILSFITNA